MEEYIQSLRKQLKDFPPEEQAALIEEITSHIESGENDRGIGQNAEQRKKKLMAELGSPKDLGKGFRTIYRPDRWIDFLFIAIPLLIIIPYLNNFLFRDYYAYIARVDVLIGLLLIAVGLWRRSALLTLFWITARVTQIAAMLFVAQGYYGRLQTVFYASLAFGLLLLWGWIVWQNRYDILVVTYCFLPTALCAVGLILVAIHPRVVLSHYGLLDGLLWNIYWNMAGSGFWVGYISWWGPILAMALFFLATNRNLRYLGLGIWGLIVGLSREYLNLDFRSPGPMDPLVYFLWVIFPLAIVLFGWWLDRRKIEQLKLAS